MTLDRTFVLAAAISLAGCATAQPLEAEQTAAASVVSATLQIAGTDYSVDWFVPEGQATALVTVQHGFSRRCSNVRGTGLRLAEAGLLGLCVNADMSGGNPALAEALAVTLLSGIQAPGGRVMPDGLIVGGHSAGGHFASRLGWKLAMLAPDRLAGALLFDPVAANASFTDNLLAVAASGQRPVLSVTANPGSCNAQGNALPALRQVQSQALAAGRDGFMGLRLIDRSSHVDVEGRDSNALGTLPCGPARRPNTEALRSLSAQWAVDLAAGTRNPAYYPGGDVVQRLIADAKARVIE